MSINKYNVVCERAYLNNQEIIGSLNLSIYYLLYFEIFVT